MEYAPNDYGLYIHVPFCEQRCHYCAFPVAVAPSAEHAPHVGRLRRELEMAGVSGTPRTLYLGGGTPSLLSPHAIRDLFDAVPAGAGEVSIEANPGTLDRSRLEAWRELGIDRVSLGVQSFDPGDLVRAGRLHAAQDSVRDIEALRGAGFANVNVDLIAGLPGQERAAWRANLDWIDRLRPEHVSVYLLELEDSSIWGRRPPSRMHVDEDHAWFYEHAAGRLAASGYRHYEISSWALPGRECRHNQGYWTGLAYRGIGLGANSLIDDRRFWNVRTMAEYARRIDRGELPVDGSEERTPGVRVTEAFMLGLRRIDGFDVWAVAKALGIDYPQDWFDRVERLAASGLVAFDGSVLRLTTSGCLLATGITEELLCPSLLSTFEATP